ncbi:unnamed protein product, partial [Symbiodinium microadriaticum]
AMEELTTKEPPMAKAQPKPGKHPKPCILKLRNPTVLDAIHEALCPLQPPVAMAEDRRSDTTGPASTAPSSPTSGHTVVDAYWMEPSVVSISSSDEGLEPCEEMLHMAREDARAKMAAMPKPGPMHGMTGPPISSVYFQ